jgi:exopolyphosphatase/guanosine-5'-triphosphate,3'-diphosphate pyrophosphatase
MSTLEAVIEIGSTGIRLLVAEIAENGTWSVIDHSELPATMGWDVFTSGIVSRETLLQCLRVLNTFKEQLRGWAIDQSHVTVISTSALREAKNRDAVLDRIMVKTGFHVNTIDGIEENRLMYLAVLDCLKDNAGKLRTENSVILEVGGGSTEIMLMEQGKMAGAHSLRLGTVIIEQHMKSMMGTLEDARRLLEEYVRNTSGTLRTELNLDRVSNFIAIGTEAQLAAIRVGVRKTDKLWSIARERFSAFVEEVQDYSIEECIARFKIPYSDAKALHVGLLSYKLFIDLTDTREILVPVTNIREGLILSKIALPNQALQEEFVLQVLESARNLARKYHADENHAEYVRSISLKLFDALRTELGLDTRARMLLEVSAILHDAGTFINPTNHQLHSQYIIEHSEIFGMSRDAMRIVSHVARYHKGPNPSVADDTFSLLPRTDRICILKLAAILRVADGIDRSHSQRIQDFSVDFTADSLIIRSRGTRATVLEKMALSEKADLFESVFGYSIILV